MIKTAHYIATISIFFLIYGCSSISQTPPIVHNEKVGTVTAEHTEFRKDATECGYEEQNKPNPTSDVLLKTAKGTKAAVGGNGISTILTGYVLFDNTAGLIHRIGQCIENKGWSLVSQ